MAKPQGDKISNSGALECVNGVLRYSHNPEPIWELSVGQLAIVETRSAPIYLIIGFLPCVDSGPEANAIV